MPRVFVVQKQHRWDERSQQFVPKFDLAPAEHYGELQFLLSPTAAPFNLKPILADLHAGLADIRSEDYLLLIGNPVLIGVATAIALDNLSCRGDGVLNLLQWSGKEKRYVVIEARDVFAT